MAWIELHQSLATHKKTRRLARALGLGVPQGIPQTIGHLCLFWLWCVDETDDGRLHGLHAQDIADASGWMGEPEKFTEAMLGAEFLDKDEDGCLSIHDWEDYIGKLMRYRKESKEKERLRKQRYRERKRREEEAEKRWQESQENNQESQDGPANSEWMKVVTAYQDNIGMMPMGTALEMLISYANDLTADVVVEAIKITNTAQPSNPWRYLKTVLDKWADTEIKTPEQARAYCKDLERKLAQHKKNQYGTTGNGVKEPPAIQGGFY